MKTIDQLERELADMKQSLEGMRLARAADHAACAQRDKRIAQLELELERYMSDRRLVELALAAPAAPVLAEGTKPGKVEHRCASCGVAVPPNWECCAACFHVGR